MRTDRLGSRAQLAQQLLEPTEGANQTALKDVSHLADINEASAARPRVGHVHHT